MQIHIQAKMTGEFSGDPYCALFTKGSFHTGFRILVSKDGRLLFQFAGLDPKTDGPLAVSTPRQAVPLDRWIDIDLLYAPPADGQAGRAEIKIDGERMTARPVAKPMPVSTAVIGIGCEFGTLLKGPFGKRRPNFPGLIRQVNIQAKAT